MNSSEKFLMKIILCSIGTTGLTMLGMPQDFSVASAMAAQGGNLACNLLAAMVFSWLNRSRDSQPLTSPEKSIDSLYNAINEAVEQTLLEAAGKISKDQSLEAADKISNAQSVEVIMIEALARKVGAGWVDFSVKVERQEDLLVSGQLEYDDPEKWSTLVSKDDWSTWLDDLRLKRNIGIRKTIIDKVAEYLHNNFPGKLNAVIVDNEEIREKVIYLRLRLLVAMIEDLKREFRDQNLMPYLRERYLKELYDDANNQLYHYMTLQTDTRPDAVQWDHAGERRRQAERFGLSPCRDMKPGAGDGKKRQFQDVLQALSEYGDSLLVLGKPGAGKTTTLLDVTLRKAEEAIRNQHASVPFFARVAKWQEGKTLKNFIEKQIDPVYLPLLELPEPLYILDGLDELKDVPQNPTDPNKGETKDPRLEFLKKLPEKAKIILTCRVQDYEELEEAARLRNAVELLPLTKEQIKDYLNKKGQTALWERIETDDNLLSLASTPLLLFLLSNAVAEHPETLDGEAGKLDEFGVFDYYFRRRFEHEEAKDRPLPFNQEKTRTTLGEIAKMLILFWGSDTRFSASEIAPEEFLLFAEKMQFIRRVAEGSFEFIHLRLRDYFALNPLIAALGDENEDADVRAGAARALGRIRDARAVEPLIAALGDENEAAVVRAGAAGALGRIRDARAVEPLIAALNDPDENVREYAEKALEIIRNKKA
jgi:hypothetical protein